MIGVGQNVNMTELLLMASEPKSENVLSVPSSDDLKNFVADAVTVSSGWEHFYPTAFKGCASIIFTHGILLVGNRNNNLVYISETIQCRKLKLGSHIGCWVWVVIIRV